VKYVVYVFLQLWYLVWLGVFISSLVRQDPNPWALVLFLLGFLLWVRFVSKDGKLWG
jgi:hypothetical protein